MMKDLDQLELFGDGGLSRDINSAHAPTPPPSSATNALKQSKPSLSDKLSKTLDNVSSQLEPDTRRQESSFRPKVITACRTYKVSSEELGRVLIQYRNLFKPTRKWTEVCQAIAEDMGCHARTLLRCIDAVEKKEPHSDLPKADVGDRTQRRSAIKTGANRIPIERQQEQLRRAFVKLMEINAVNKDDTDSRRAFYRAFLAQLEADLFGASDDFKVEVQGRRRQIPLGCPTPTAVVEKAA